MANRTLIIRIVDRLVYFNPDYCIPFSQTNFPQDALAFKPHRVFYWEVEMGDIPA